MENTPRDLEPIRQAFAKAFIEAISAKSVEGCADLVLTYEDCNTLEVDYGLSAKKYRKRLVKQSKNFLKEKKKFIDSKNENSDSAITLQNFEEIDTYKFKLEDGYDAGFIKTISISMKTRRVDGMCYQVGFQIDDAILVNGKIRINNMLGVKMSESYWEEITKENTPYPLVQDKEVLRALVKKHAPDYAEKSYMNDVLRNLRDWYVHEGDLTLDSYKSVKVGLIVTGNLTLNEPLSEITHELIVLGQTRLNALNVEETNNILLLGGIEFKVGIFIGHSGAYLIFNQPRGPFFHTEMEYFDIDDGQGIDHFCAPYADVPNDISKFLLEEFYEIEEPDEDEDPEDEIPTSFNLDYEAIFEAIRAGKTIFKQ